MRRAPGFILALILPFGVSACSPRSGAKDAEPAVQKGKDYLKAGDFDNAIAAFSEAIQLKASVHAYAGRAEAHRMKSNLDQAISDTEEALRLKPDHAYAYATKAAAYHAKGQNDAALAAFDAAIKVGQNESVEWKNWAQEWRNRVLAVKAQADTAAASNDKKQNTPQTTGSSPTANDPSVEALKSNPLVKAALAEKYFKSAQAHLEKANYAQSNDGECERHRKNAIDDFMMALRFNPTADIYNALCWELATSNIAKLRDPSKAIEFGRKACDLTEWKAPGHIDSLAAAYAASNDFDAAVQCQRRAILAASPEFEQDKIYRWMPAAGHRLQLYERKTPYFVPPMDDERTAYNLLMSLPAQKDYILQEWRLLMVHHEQAFKYIRQGKKMEAYEELTIGIILYPFNQDVHVAYGTRGKLAIELVEYDQAMRDLSMAISRWPQQESKDTVSAKSILGKLHLNRAFVYVEQKDYQKALADLDLTAQYDPQSAVVARDFKRRITGSQSGVNGRDLETMAVVVLGAYALGSMLERRAPSGTSQTTAPAPARQGTWAKELATCSSCGGRGTMLALPKAGSSSWRAPCARCGGSGLHDEWRYRP